MSQQDISDNPFASLLSGGSAQMKETNTSTSTATTSGDAIQLSNKLEEVFLITLNTDASPGRPSFCVFLPDLHTSLGAQTTLDLDCLKEAVFERLMSPEPEDFLVTATVPVRGKPHDAKITDPLVYLYQSYCRLKAAKFSPALIKACEDVIILNSKMAFLHPDIFPNEAQPTHFILTAFLGNEGAETRQKYEYLERMSQAIAEDQEEDPGSLALILRPVLDAVKREIQKDASLGNPRLFAAADMLLFFTRKPCLGEVLLDHCQPQKSDNGRSYEDTVLGSILGIGCISSNEAQPSPFFDTPSSYTKQQIELTENTIHTPLGTLTEKLYMVVYNLLKLSTSCKERILSWIGGCLHANKGRAKIWSNQMLPPMIFGAMYCSDAFFLNLCSVLLRLSRPFAQPRSPKLLKIQPSYCLATAKPTPGIHMKDISDETMLVPAPSSDDATTTTAKTEDSYNFISECFFMTQYALKLGVCVVHERFRKLSQELGRIQSAYQDIERAGATGTDVGARMKDAMEKKMSVFLCLKAALTEPTMLALAFQFHVSTATWLVHMTTADKQATFSDLVFPLPESVPVSMSCIPELVAENLMDFLLFLRRYKDSVYEDNAESLNHLMTFILVFMGSPSRMRNPHFRANMAEALEALMPPKQDDRNTYFNMSFVREQLFQQHPHISELARTLLEVFVSIEMTGQGVEFEQKFNYRRPMYNVLEYLCTKDNHRKALLELAEEAEAHVEDPQAPLFLRFINLLVNDAIFLLDEALTYMSQIKEKQGERESGAWEQLEQRARQEAESNYQHLRLLARFHNIMASQTITSLELLTRHIRSIFVHPVMVERISAMLNYFLLHLVGPKQKELKVKNREDFEFKPGELVESIVQLYLNLGESAEFCAAVSRDGRSYSHALFVQTAKLLQEKIGAPLDKTRAFGELGIKIKNAGAAAKEEEDIVAEAPEHFLDPIMGTLMRDPVLLPTSGNIMDRQTIARHILSDQTDPFNRQPLSMEMIVPAEELKAEISAWMQERGLTL